MAIDTTNGSNFAWNSGNVWKSGVLRDGGSIFLTHNGADTTAMNPTSYVNSYPQTYRVVRFDNPGSTPADFCYTVSGNSGANWIECKVHDSANLSGVGTFYIRSLFQGTRTAGSQIEIDTLTCPFNY